MNDWQDQAVEAGWISGEAAERLAEQVRHLKRRLDELKAAPTFSDGYQEGFTDAMNDVAGA